jgi:hypothetical protein
MGALKYNINASVAELVITIFPVWINRNIDVRLSMGLYIMPLTTSVYSFHIYCL